MGFLRTLLALSVVLDHLGGGTTDWLVGGRLAVQLFYVISGFLISYVLTATDHYKDRSGGSMPIGPCACIRCTWRWQR